MVSRMIGNSARPQTLVDAVEERCPLCKQPLPHTLSAKDLEARLEQGRAAAAEATANRLRAEFQRSQACAVEAVRKKAIAEFQEREKTIRAEAKAEAQGETKAQLQAANAQKLKAEQDKRSAEEQLKRVKSGQDEFVKGELAKALRKQRESLDKEKTDAVHRSEAQAFKLNQKLQKQIDALQRQLEQKSAAELGEGAEIDLYESLREHFEGDTIRRIKHGQPGADIRHEVIHNKQVCGSILYDSKNHRGWRDEFVQKLKADQLADKADHAVVSSSAFPAGESQLCVRGEVIVANPARVVDLVTIIRAQIIQTHRLRLSAEERVRKTEKLYDFINSGRCQQLTARYAAIAEDLLELETKEVDAHKRTWEKRGKLIRDAQKVHGDFQSEIDRIIAGGDLP